MMDAVKAELNNMVESGVIRYVTEPTDWCAAMVPVVKKTGAVRICVDLKQLNTAVQQNWPVTEDRLTETRVETSTEPIMKSISYFIANRWPNMKVLFHTLCEATTARERYSH